MSNYKFKPGDRVRYNIKDFVNHQFQGQLRTIESIHSNYTNRVYDLVNAGWDLEERFELVIDPWEIWKRLNKEDI